MDSIYNIEEFTVSVKDGEVYINGEFIAQLCVNSTAIGCAVANWIDRNNEEDEEEDN